LPLTEAALALGLGSQQKKLSSKSAIEVRDGRLLTRYIFLTPLLLLFPVYRGGQPLPVSR